ncbi:hypothetical protein [Pseudonocardia sp.]|uniref:hypothetical protein n=1 Tax=Pseudonocardia sp. TaxID=60912 RepID=UPI0031FDED18
MIDRVHGLITQAGHEGRQVSPDDDIQVVSERSSLDYLSDRVVEILRHRRVDHEEIPLLLDGRVSSEMRQRIPLASRRALGAFFTPSGLARSLLGPVDVDGDGPVVDPSCGAGDLLLAAAAKLPLRSSVRTTLALWGTRLHARDLETDFVRLARLRIALLASVRVGQVWDGDEAELAGLLCNVAAGDGLTLSVEESGLWLYNPPFGSVVVTDHGWASGRTSRAAAFFASSIDSVASGSRFRAILPDVLRSGTNYRRWRQHVARIARLDAPRAIGQFDKSTDVDVFVLAGIVVPASNRDWPTGPPRSTTNQMVGDLFKVHVGVVVPHRDAHQGEWSPYVHARGLPVGVKVAPSERRRHFGTRFKPPFVAIRRTSRPQQTTFRASATIITGTEPVLVENHLLVCVPKDGTLRSCRKLMSALHQDETDQWLNEQIRCRHLTVGAVRSIPFVVPEASSSSRRPR